MNNPIKHIKFSDVDYFKPDVQGGGSNKPLKEVTNEFKRQLVLSINGISKALQSTPAKLSIGVAAAVVELESNAIAKSHRPTKLFNNDTCPFFGDVGYSRFLIQVSIKGLAALSKKIELAQSQAAIKDLSTIKSIDIYKPEGSVLDDKGVASVRLFRFNSAEMNRELDEKFEAFVDSCKATWEKHPSEAVRLYRVKGNFSGFEYKMSHFVGVQSVVSSRSITVKPMVLSNQAKGIPTIPHPEDKDYPVVAVVDSGVSSSCLPISPWVSDRVSYVHENYRNDHHGTFVSGLVASSYHLNGQDQRFPRCQAKIFSVEVLGNEAGDIYDIINAMYEVAEDNPHIKVWNLSLGSTAPVSMARISDMAIMLDEFQDRNNCLCVVAAGNYEGAPRAWPPVAKIEDGISSPGDSVRCLTVGSLAHVDGFVKTDEPSHFSRKGPVSNYIQKPEVVHYGGNILEHNNRKVILGVNSLGADGSSRDDIGTSFSTPIISSVAANLFHKIGDKATPGLVKAMLVHSANLKQSVSNGEYKAYYGWGIPQDTQDILSVQDYESTMVFEGVAEKSFEVQKLPFPIPSCLRTEDNKVRAEFFITLVYQPELDPQKAFEYCQMDINVGFGKQDDNGRFTSKVPLQKDSHGFEQDLVKSGDKWSPVKVYQAKFPKGVDIENWKLRVSVLDRDGYDPEGVLIPFSIIITIRDIDKEQPVYDEMARLMDIYNWEVSDLVVDTQIQI